MAAIKLGILVPSSNTAIEPIISQIFADVNSESNNLHVTAHFSRVRVTLISNEASAASQFDLENMLSAASLLADAKVNAIGWGGTSAGWLGINKDVELCKAIEQRFRVPAFTSTLSLIEALKVLEINRIGLVTPYTSELNQDIMRNFAQINIKAVAGYTCLALTDNIDIGNTTEPQLHDLALEVVEADKSLQAVTTFCTNLKTAHFAATWEEQLSNSAETMYILDSVSVLIWKMLQSAKAGSSFGSLSKRWGKLFTVKHRLDVERR